MLILHLIMIMVSRQLMKTEIGTVPIMLYCMGGTEDEVGLCGGIVCLIQTIVMCVPIIMTERALKRNFHKDGTRRINIE